MKKLRKQVAGWLLGSSEPFKGIPSRWLVRIAFSLLAVYVSLLGVVGGKPLHVDPDQARISALVAALKRYKAARGHFPHGSQAEIMSTLQGGTPRQNAYYPGFYKLYGTFNERGELVDTWGTPYRIDLKAEQPPRVSSAGKNQVFEGDAPGSDDIRSWQ